MNNIGTDDEGLLYRGTDADTIDMWFAMGLPIQYRHPDGFWKGQQMVQPGWCPLRRHPIDHLAKWNTGPHPTRWRIKP